MQDTFLHEVMHALTAAFDLKEKDKEESFVRRLATGICTVWNDNPKAFKWWRELVKLSSAYILLRLTKHHHWKHQILANDVVNYRYQAFSKYLISFFNLL